MRETVKYRTCGIEVDYEWQPPEVRYANASPNELWWCNSHKRKATFVRFRPTDAGPQDIKHVCDPNLGGIMLPCECVELTDIAEIETVES